MKIKMFTKLTLIAVVIFTAVLYVNASVSTFTNRTFYNNAANALGTTKNIDFSQRDNAAPMTSPGSDVYIDPLTLKGVTFNGARSYYNLMIYTGPNGKIRANLPANTYAFGVDMARFYGTAGTFTITLSTGETYQLNGNAANSNFLGFYSDEPLQWAEYSFNNDYIVLDNFTYTVKTPNQLSGLVSYWTADNHAVDVIGSNDGTPRGGTSYAPGAVGQAFNLDGVSRYVEMPDSTSLSLTGPLTLEARIKLNTNSVQQAIIEKYDVPGLNGYLLRIQGGKLAAAMCNTTLAGAQQGIIGATTVTPGVWHHVAAVYDGATIKIYLDGVLDGSVVANFAPTNGSASLKIGARGDDANTRLNGLIDDVRIYNRALSEEEIQTAMTFDTTPPVIAPVATGSLGNNDWYTSDVQVNWNVTDAESSVSSSSGCDVSNVTQDTSGVTFTCSATSSGGTATQSVTIKRDATAPEINALAVVNGNPYTGGWTNQNVVVSFNCSDALSGITFQTDPITINSEGANQSANGSCTDAAGNSIGTTFSNVNIDKTAPLISCAPADGVWHAADVSRACAATENVSSLVNAPDANFNLVTNVPVETETSSAATDSRQVCDVAGNCANSGSLGGNKVDKKAPSITISEPTAGNYLLNQAVTVNYSCNDGGSGTLNCTGTTANGGLLDTATVGAKTFSVSAVDNVGNTATPLSVNYTVGFGIDILFDQTKSHKSGSTIPIKIRLLDANGVNVSTASTVVHASSVIQLSNQTSISFDDAGNSNPEFDFRYDQSLGGYIFNLKTTGFVPGTYKLNFIAGASNAIYSVQFQVRQ